jgi:hypothetical protein
MTSLYFGRIEGLKVRAGEPVLDPPPTFIRTIKIGAEKGIPPGAIAEDFWLKHQMVELLDVITRVGEGDILSIEIRHGLPFAMEVEHRPSKVGDHLLASSSGDRL